MSGRWALPLLASVFLLIAGATVVSAAGGVTKLPYGDLVTGIVERVDGEILTVGGKSYDTRNATMRFMKGMTPLEKSALRGARVEILIQKGRIHSILVLPVKGE